MEIFEPVKDVLYSVENPQEAAATSLSAKIASIKGLLTFPAVAQMALKVLGNPDFRMTEVASIINRDPALASKVMRLANSAYFSRGKPVDSLQKAMVRLGRANVHEAVCAVATMDMFPDVKGIGQEIRDHSAATAALTHQLVCDLLPSHKEGAFLCGLLHDMGKLLLIASREMLYDEALPEEMMQPEFSVALERARLGFDHAVLAGQILWHWNFPAPIPQVVAWHHEPELAAKDQDVAYVVSMVRIASRIERQLSYNISGLDDFICDLMDSPDGQFAALSENYLQDTWGELAAQRASAISLFL